MVALVVPKRKPLAQLAQTLGFEATAQDDTESWSILCQNEQLCTAVLKDMQQMALKRGLERFEMPQKVHLTPEPWTAESGLITDAFKLKRKPIQEKFQAEIDSMYGGKN